MEPNLIRWAPGFYIVWYMVTIPNMNTIHVLCRRYHKNTKVIESRNTCPILAQNQNVLYTHQASVVVDHCTQYEQNRPIYLGDISKNRHNL